MNDNGDPKRIFRSEFEVEADLVLATGTENFQMVDHEGFSSTLRNAATGPSGGVPGLLAVVVGPGTSIDDAVDAARLALAAHLDLLTFATHSRYRITSQIRVMEWTPGQRTRAITWFKERDERYPPLPELRSTYAEAVSQLAQADLPAYVRTALRAFRRGLLEEMPEDQFTSLWLALEVIAENTKDRTRAPIPCGKCKAPLTCSACGHTPTRIPLPKDVIAKLVADRTGPHIAADVAKGLLKARNGLMHGQSVESIEQDCGGPLHAIANALANVVWHAIHRIASVGDPKGEMLHRSGQFLSRRVLAAVHGSFEYVGPEPHPPDGSLPTLTLDWETNYEPSVKDSE